MASAFITRRGGGGSVRTGTATTSDNSVLKIADLVGASNACIVANYDSTGVWGPTMMATAIVIENGEVVVATVPSSGGYAINRTLKLTFDSTAGTLTSSAVAQIRFAVTTEDPDVYYKYFVW